MALNGAELSAFVREAVDSLTDEEKQSYPVVFDTMWTAFVEYFNANNVVTITNIQTGSSTVTGKVS